jgi:glutamate racemase
MTRPIGVFDSGIGGLTVLREIVRALPGQSIVFLGDTARVPYGTRGVEVIAGFADELAGFLMQHDVQYLVAACNTISSTCLEQLQQRLPVPVLGVVEPAVSTAVARTKSGKIGVIGTRATVSSGFYESRIKAADPAIEVSSQACPLFVPLAEEGMLDAEATRLIAAGYLAPLRGKGIDTLILGCTHYPLLRSIIEDVMGPGVALVDSAAPTAEELARRLSEGGIASERETPDYDLFVTDAPQRVETVARLFFGEDLPGRLQKVTL